jgi:transcriptional regulator with XRE-family HTH domain
MDHYGVILRKLRELNQLTIKQAASSIERSAGWLSEVEGGRGLSKLMPSEFERIVAIYGGDRYRKQFGIWIAKAKAPYVPPKEVVFNGAILKHLRKKSNLTLDEAAEKIGLSGRYLSAMETGRRRLSSQVRDQLMPIYGYSPSSFKNFATEDKRAKNIPARYKLESLLKLLDESGVERVFAFALESIGNQAQQQTK